MSTPWGSLLRLAAEQHQVVAIRQVAPLGIDPATFRRRGRRDDWIEHGGTLWSPPGTRLDDWGVAMRAALWGRAQAAVTGMAALRLQVSTSRCPLRSGSSCRCNSTCHAPSTRTRCGSSPAGHYAPPT